MADKKGGAPRKEEVVTREYTVNLHKRLHGWYATSPALSLLARRSVPAARSDSIVHAVLLYSCHEQQLVNVPCHTSRITFGRELRALQQLSYAHGQLNDLLAPPKKVEPDQLSTVACSIRFSNGTVVKRSSFSTFKKKAPNAIKELRKFAQKAMGTTDVRIDVKLNKLIWSSGIRSVPRRVRVRIARRRNDEEDAKEELYSLVTVAEVPAEGLKGLGTKVVDDTE
ncbi:60S ribosomal protein L31 [Triticum urartu]|uniref:60S ribosomal protein L31 n=2 Tax=Triticinae TaxID=1648030 RepID=M7ZJS3_TRIUA|nr:60S ribosomal protein L31 [Triticum urartu]